MDKLLEYCKARYDEEVGFKFGLANIFSWLFFVICTRISSGESDQNLMSGLSAIKVKDILDMTDGVIPSITSLELLYSIGFVLILSWLAREMSEGLFYCFTLKSDFQLLIIEITIVLHSRAADEAKRKALGLGAKTEMERNQKKLRRKRCLAEMALSIGISTAIMLPLAGINIIAVAAGIIGFVILTWSSFHYFISDILPYQVAIKYSTGELTQIRDSYTSSQK